MKGFEYLPLQASNLDSVFGLIGTVAREEINMPAEAVDRYRDAVSKAAGLPGKGYGLCCLCGGEVAGALICPQPEGGVATVLWLVVDKKYRGLGVGTGLFLKARRWAEANGCHKIKLTASSEGAVIFYRRLGMEIEGVHKNHWWHLDFWSLGMMLCRGEGSEQ